MPFDGGFMRKISQEINLMSGAHLDKISQPSREILILSLHGPGGGKKLLLSLYPEIHLSNQCPNGSSRND